MQEFVRALSARSSSFSRTVRPPLSVDSLASRCPSLWWSLALFALGWRADRPSSLAVELPAAVPVSMAGLAASLLEASAEDVGEGEAAAIMEDAVKV
mmetsp:Transcript_81255/g.263470  ORF Transcript_81255/g.263470 Transcript_81255/m.263470 type:complete len:97 (+) Transcript_81255:276-566(+)